MERQQFIYHEATMGVDLRVVSLILIVTDTLVKIIWRAVETSMKIC